MYGEWILCCNGSACRRINEDKGVALCRVALYIENNETRRYQHMHGELTGLSVKAVMASRRFTDK